MTLHWPRDFSGVHHVHASDQARRDCINPLAVPAPVAVARPAPVTNGGAGQSGFVPPHATFDTVREQQDHA